MGTNEINKIVGEYHFEGFNDGVKVHDSRVKNVVCQNYFDNLLKALKGESSTLDVVDFATGDDATTALKADTALGNELFRMSVTQITYTTTQLKVITQISPPDSNFLIKEVGIFFSDGGILSHANTNIDKNASTQYTVTYTLTVI